MPNRKTFSSTNQEEKKYNVEMSYGSTFFKLPLLLYDSVVEDCLSWYDVFVL